MRLNIIILKSAMLKHSNSRLLFTLYCCIFLVYGAVVNSLGPLFPYLSARELTPETAYSLLFVFRAVGYLLGSLACKYLQGRLSNHHLISLACLLLSIACLLLVRVPSSMGYKCVLMVVSGWGCAQLNMFLHAGVIYLYRDGGLEWHLVVAHGAFGVGGLLGPGLVWGLEFGCYGGLGVVMGVAVVVFWCWHSPESEGAQGQQTHTKQSLQDELVPRQQSAQVQLPSGIALMMCPIFMLVVGQETIFGGWAPSYAVMSHISDKATATAFSSVFWISITAFRLVMLYIPGRSTQKLLYLFALSLLCSLLSPMLMTILPAIPTLYCSAIVYGLSTSVLYALALSLPQEHGLVLTQAQSSNFILSSAFGEGVLAVVAGKMMEWVGPDAMFGVLGAMAVGGWLLVRAVVARMTVVEKMPMQGVEMQQTK